MKPGIPKGTRDFSPEEMGKRNFIFSTIKDVFQRYGYLPIETPAMENLSTLTGKYGDEGDKLIFKILNSGSFWDSVEDTSFLEDYLLKRKQQDEILAKPKEQRTEADNRELERLLGYFTGVNRVISTGLTNQISEKALRYDLTVPFARYVVQHQNEITFPFKRYQMQPVWRADRPQKGRYREFYQCDADVIGSNSLLNEVELVYLMNEVFAKLKLHVIIKINNRKILSGIAEIIDEKDKIVDITVAIDKLDKIGRDKVLEELKTKGLKEKAIQKIEELFAFTGNSTDQKIAFLEKFLANSEIGKKGIEEVKYIFNSAASSIQSSNLELDITLARGLNYYTGAIFEVKANAGTFGSSICGGGRYDDLTGIFGLPNVSGVGISFGVDRIYDVMEELKLFPETIVASTKILFVNFGETEQTYCLPLLSKVRQAGINAEIYPDQTKVKKQFDYANKKEIPYVIVVGTDEMQSGELTFKNMSSGEQEKLTIEQIIERLK